ncbi:SPOR domain-containing protein [Thermoflavimicrobium dichotomicum]|uniref:Sporulation related domain-containing protein n=1 Tax=Thermoflavimicrobium dichotomicum TaxID=46223 RepID=A0A1I3LVH3_9BACL|nr:SPOR domain-containing protein [Thermoflavimicrobium dichotomicum]SFI88456.1 Sporulation related domain-containing protein [Thermoflavimicrobium dichotomicum]
MKNIFIYSITLIISFLLSGCVIKQKQEPTSPHEKIEVLTPQTETKSSKEFSSSKQANCHVIVGSFKEPQNAQKRVKELESKGFHAEIMKVQVNGTTWYRVNTGSYPEHSQCQDLLNHIESAGFDGFIADE